jgi:hypothetical protein
MFDPLSVFAATCDGFVRNVGSAKSASARRPTSQDAHLQDRVGAMRAWSSHGLQVGESVASIGGALFERTDGG